MDPIAEPQPPIRLVVKYPSARALLNDYTKSISKGGIAMESERNIRVGQPFVFELRTPDLSSSLEMKGLVTWTRPSDQPGKFTVGIQYSIPDEQQRDQFQRLIENVLADHQWERQRKHPRIPVSVEVRADKRIWTMRDLSLGGAMLQAVSYEPLDEVPGDTVHLLLRVGTVDLVLVSAIAWVAQAFHLGQEQIAGRIGIQFTQLTPAIAPEIEKVMRSEVVPTFAQLIISTREPGSPAKGGGNAPLPTDA